LPATSSDLPAEVSPLSRRTSWAKTTPAYLVLLTVGFTLPSRSPPTRCALTAPFHPYSDGCPPERYIFCGTFRRLTPDAPSGQRPVLLPRHCWRDPATDPEASDGPSVLHPLGPAGGRGLAALRPTWSSAGSIVAPAWPCTGWGLPGRHVTVTPVRSYRTFSPLPAPGSRAARHLGGLFLWHFPAAFAGSVPRPPCPAVSGLSSSCEPAITRPANRIVAASPRPRAPRAGSNCTPGR